VPGPVTKIIYRRENEMKLALTATVRVRYAETDAMGVMHHSVWPVYWELGRTELIRMLAKPYAELERDDEILFPLTSYTVHMKKPALYDDEMEIFCRVTTLSRVRIGFEYEGRRGDQLVATGSTEHGILNRSWKIVKLPPEIAAKLKP
jgi:acyl-CoA thioester hydrolase